MQFRFRALTSDGRPVSGVADHADHAGAVAALRQRGHLPIEVAPASGTNRLAALLNTDLTPRGALKVRDRVAFTDGLATLLGAGVTLDRALEISGELAPRRAIRALLVRLHERVIGGASLSDALEAEGAAFPPIYRGIVRAGEASANLAPVLARLAISEAESAKRRATLISALIYPAFLVATAIASVTVLLIFVVPTFEPMLAAAGTELPTSTRMVIASGKIVAALWPFLLAVVLLGALLWRIVFARPAARAALHRALLRLPLIGPLRRKLASAGLTRLLGELLEGGVALPNALRLTRDGLSDAAFRVEMARIQPKVEAGESLSTCFAEGRILSRLAINLIDVGVRSGRLSEMMTRAAAILDDDARTTLDRMMALLTPVVTLLMGGVIALIVSSILFALFSLNDLAGA